MVEARSVNVKHTAQLLLLLQILCSVHPLDIIHMHVDASRDTLRVIRSSFSLNCTRPVCFIFILFPQCTQRGGGGGVYALPDFLFFSFSCSTDHERD